MLQWQIASEPHWRHDVKFTFRSFINEPGIQHTNIVPHLVNNMSPPRGSASASSPHSEHDTTFHGTPSTNLTSFTPEAAPGTKGKGREDDIYTKAREVLKVKVAEPARYVHIVEYFFLLSHTY